MLLLSIPSKAGYPSWSTVSQCNPLNYVPILFSPLFLHSSSFLFIIWLLFIYLCKHTPVHNHQQLMANCKGTDSHQSPCKVHYPNRLYHHSLDMCLITRLISNLYRLVLHDSLYNVQHNKLYDYINVFYISINDILYIILLLIK